MINKNDHSSDSLKTLGNMIDFDIPETCLDGVQQNLKILEKYSQIIHHFSESFIKEDS